MTSEIESYLDQVLSLKQDVPGIVGGLSDEAFNWRPATDRWSIAQCLDHLNLTAAQYVPVIEAATTEARRVGLLSPGPFSYPLLQRWFVHSQEPPVKRRMRTFKRLAPQVNLPLRDVVTQFMQWQDRLTEQLQRADGIDLQRARHRSPILPLLTFRLGMLFAVTLAHERRHLWQAKQIRTHPNFPAA